jgi:outer membrane lipoprotein SlyB
MMIKRLIVLLMVTTFALGVAGISFSAQEVKGTVSKIEGNKLTILDDMGKQITVEVKDQESLRKNHPDMKVLVLTHYSERIFSMRSTGRRR